MLQDSNICQMIRRLKANRVYLEDKIKTCEEDLEIWHKEKGSVNEQGKLIRKEILYMAFHINTIDKRLTDLESNLNE